MHIVVKRYVSVSNFIFPTLNENALDAHVCCLVNLNKDEWSFKAMNRSFQR